MYQAKESGRNCYQFFKPEMNSKAVQRQSVENGLRIAIERQAFVLHYQPKFNLQTGAITAVEALVRWRHPMRGVLPPSEFMSVAEDSGLIVPSAGGCSTKAAARQKPGGMPVLHPSAWPSTSPLSSCARKLLCRTFALCCRIIRVSTRKIWNSSSRKQDPKATTSVLQSLWETGVRFALDDFGTGYSSLSYMRRFPIDTLKIDQSFVRDVTTDEESASVVQAIIDMGRGLRMRVVAEGVETREQLHFLQERACPEAQGYFLGRPAIAKHIGRLLAADSIAGSRTKL